MLKYSAVLLLCLLTSCTHSSPDTDGTVDDPLDPVEQQVADWLAQMTLEEKVAQMSGSFPIFGVDGTWEQPGLERLGIPALKMLDGPRGANKYAGNATAFPVAMARGATWDPELERRVGRAIASEASAKGANVLLAPVIAVLRHPAWGRAQETYGEDTHHIGRMGVAFIEGAQEILMASAKHYAVNSIEDTRFDVDVTLSERTLREIYLPHFERAVKEAGVGSVMASYNSVNGHFCAENAHLLTDILKEEWGFTGFVESDWMWGMNSTGPSALAGLDIEMPYPQFYGDALLAAVADGEVPEDAIDEAVRRILRQKVVFDVGNPPDLGDVVESAAHTALAREVEEAAIVLLENKGNALPLDRDQLSSIAVLGPFADDPNLGDAGSSDVQPSYTVTPLVGLEEASQSVTIHYVPGATLTPEEAGVVAAADAAIVVVGLDENDEGEQIPTFPGGDRDTLSLSAEDIALVHEVAALNDRTIVVLEGGSAITVEEWVDDVEAVVMAWYPGMEGGNALASVLYGEVSPRGRLPFTVPVAMDQLPPFDHASLEVDYGFYQGYRHVDHEGTEPRYPFGYGLSYTTFELANLRLSAPSGAAGETVTVQVDVTNTGPVAGDEVVQVYVGAPSSDYERAPRDLRGFQRVRVASGATETVQIPVAVDDLAVWDDGWTLEATDYEITAGGSSRDLMLQAVFSVESR